MLESSADHSPDIGSTRNAQLERWSPTALIAFRFVFCYLVLYLLYLLEELCFFVNFYQGKKDSPELISLLWHVIVPRVASGIFHWHIDVPPMGNSSTDTAYDFVLVLLEIILAALATIIWSALDRNRKNYRVLHAWQRLGVQFFLSAMVLSYGLDKLIPLQFGNLTLSTLLRPVGEMSHMTLLWTFMAASPPYTVFTGFIEVLGGILVLFRRTVTVGALICFGAMCNVLALNLGYDVSIKLQAFHFAMLALFLLVPDLRRLADFFLFSRPAYPRLDAPLSNSQRVDRIVHLGVSAIGLCLCAFFLFYMHRGYERIQADLAEHGPLYGVWDVDQFTIQGQKPGPLFTPQIEQEMMFKPGHESWRRLVFDSSHILIIEVEGPINDYVKPAIDSKTNTLTITDEGDPKWVCKLNFKNPEPASMQLQGEINGIPVMLMLHKEDDSRFVLTTSRFHLINEQAPFN